MHKDADIYIHIYKINKFRSYNPGVFLKIGTPKMCAKSWKDTCEELHFLQRCEL